MDEKGERIKRYKLPVTKTGDVKCRIENMVNNIITTYHVR